MAVNIKMAIQSRNPIDDTKATRTLGYINRDYLATVGFVSTEPPTPGDIVGVPLPYGYESFWIWADTIARRLNSLTSMTFVDATISGEWSTTEEINS